MRVSVIYSCASLILEVPQVSQSLMPGLYVEPGRRLAIDRAHSRSVPATESYDESVMSRNLASRHRVTPSVMRDFTICSGHSLGSHSRVRQRGWFHVPFHAGCSFSLIQSHPICLDDEVFLATRKECAQKQNGCCFLRLQPSLYSVL